MKRVLKKSIKAICYSIAFLFSLIFNNFTVKAFNYMIGLVNSINFKRKLKRHGKNTRICRLNVLEGLNFVEVGDDFSAGSGFWLGTYKTDECKEPKIKIGNNVHCSRNVHIGAIDEIIIEDNVLIGSNILITDHSHGNGYCADVPVSKAPLHSKGKVQIRENTWICDSCVILPGVTIGSNCIVAAGSIVTKSFDVDGAVIAGNPAKIVKYLNSLDDM